MQKHCKNCVQYSLSVSTESKLVFFFNNRKGYNPFKKEHCDQKEARLKCDFTLKSSFNIVKNESKTWSELIEKSCWRGNNP